jgi:hypothetical protein
MRTLRLPAMLGGMLLMLAQGACDPCFGVALCNVAPRATVSGQLLNDTTGAPEVGATLDLIRVGGVGMTPDSVRATTDADGLFLLDADAAEIGDVVLDIVVRPRSGPGYRAHGITVRTTTRGGEAFVLPPWSTVPHLPDFAEIFRRGGAQETIGNVAIEFRRTGGVALRDLPGDVYSNTTTATGFVPLFGDQIQPVDAGDVIGTFTVFLPPPAGPSIEEGFRIRATPEFRRAAQIRRIGAGPSLNYLFQARRRARPEVTVPGVILEFQQTSGPETTPAIWSVTTDAAGSAFLPARAQAEGTVAGQLTVRPPAPFTDYVTTKQFPTFQSDTIVVETIGVGPWFPHFVIIRANGSRLAGARVDVQRISGIQTTPALYSAVTNDSGMVHLRTEPTGPGEMIADLTVTPPAPFAPFTLRGVRLQAVDADVPGGRTLLGDWDVTSPPASAIRDR